MHAPSATPTPNHPPPPTAHTPTQACLLKGYMNDTHATKTEAPTQTDIDRRHTLTQGRAREFDRGLGISENIPI